MKTLLSGLMATALAASFAMPLPLEANAAAVYVPKSEQVQRDQAVRSDVQQVHSRRWLRRHRAVRRSYWRDRYYGDPYYEPYYYRSYNGFRPHHRYYRRHRPGVSIWLNF